MISKKPKIVRVSIAREEGPTDMCRQHDCKSFDEAQKQVFRWKVATWPASGYDKCTVEVEWDNGHVHRLRYDLESSGPQPTIRKVAMRTLEKLACRNLPTGVTEGRLMRQLGKARFEQSKEMAARMLDEYEWGEE